MEYMGNNRTEIIGSIEDDFRFSHQVYGENFYLFTLKVPRLSGIDDYIKVMISERLLTLEEFHTGDLVKIVGQFRSYNNIEESSNKLVLTVFVKDITHVEGENIQENPNNLFLSGFVCKEPVYRTTPFGREITDILLAVNRTYNKSDYIPIIAWGRNARFAMLLNVGDHIQVWGRIQSRNYQKRIDENQTITKTAYEVSVNRIEMAPEEGKKDNTSQDQEDEKE